MFNFVIFYEIFPHFFLKKKKVNEMFQLKRVLESEKNVFHIADSAVAAAIKTESIVEMIESKRYLWQDKNMDFFGFYSSTASDFGAVAASYKISYASLDKVIIASKDDDNFPGNLTFDFCFYPIQKYEKEKTIFLGSKKNNLTDLNWFYFYTTPTAADINEEYFMQENFQVLNTSKIQTMKDEKKYRELYKYLKPFLKYKVLSTREDDLHIAIKTCISSLDNLKATNKYQKWAYFLTFTYKFIYPMFEFAKYARYYSHHNVSYATILLLRKLLMFDKDYRPKNNEEILIKDTMLDFEETILSSYMCSKQFGLECSIRYLLKKKTNIDNVIQNLQFYTPLMDDYIEIEETENNEETDNNEEIENDDKEIELCKFPIVNKGKLEKEEDTTGWITSWKPFILSVTRPENITTEILKKTTTPIDPYTMYESNSLFGYLDLKTITNVCKKTWLVLATLSNEKFLVLIRFDGLTQKPLEISLPFRSDKIKKIYKKKKGLERKNKEKKKIKIIQETGEMIKFDSFTLYKTCLKFLQV